MTELAIQIKGGGSCCSQNLNQDGIKMETHLFSFHTSQAFGTLN